MRFIHPASGHMTETTVPFLWAFLCGPLYFLWHEDWAGTLVCVGAGLSTLGVSWFIVPFFASRLIRRAYLRKGWHEVGRDVSEVSTWTGWRDVRRDTSEIRPWTLADSPMKYKYTPLFLKEGL